MLVSAKWQMMWLESQYCSKSIVNWPLPSQQAQKVLEDLKRSCCSPNKAAQLEALKCWDMWINHQNPDDWKLNTVCFTGVQPLITKKLQPLHKDADICKMKLSLMWALLRKVQNLMQFEGPQYILEVFLQSCLTWLTSNSVDNCENEISTLIFQLLLGIFNKNESLDACDSEIFSPLSTELFHGKKVFHRFVDKFLNIFFHWRIIRDKSVFLRLWKYFLEHCELSCDYIPTPLWHRIFKLASQICSEKNETVKVRLAVLHSCATSLKSSLSSSKFMDFGTLVATSCEALLKKLVELCRVEGDEFCDLEMFLHSKEICEVLLSKSVAFEGLDLCIGVLDDLEEFYLRSLFWGVWCGLVYFYKVLLLDLDKNQFTRTQLKFYRKLRGIAINFELDRDKLYKDCVIEVERNIDILNIGCLCPLRSVSKKENAKVKDCRRNVGEMEALDLVRVESENQSSQNLDSTALFQSVLNRSSKEAEDNTLARYREKFSAVALRKKSHLLPRKTVTVKIDLIKEILKNIDMNSTKSLFNCLFNFSNINLKTTRHNLFNSLNYFSLYLEFGSDNKKETDKAVYCLEAKAPSDVSESKQDKKSDVLVFKKNKKTKVKEGVISVRSTRSRKREEEEKRMETERPKRKKRKSFEVLVQEIVRKNKERKTEKNGRQRKSSVVIKSKRNKKKMKEELKNENETERKKKEKKPEEAVKRKLRNSKKEEPNNKVKKEKKICKTDGKLENYFKVITKKMGTEGKKEVKKSKKGKKTKKNLEEINCCQSQKEKGEKKNEIGWKQTSLKMMMNQRSKTVKVKQGLRPSQKATDITDEKQKTKKDKKMAKGPLASPFKEVFHDHEYAKLQIEKLKSFKKILHGKKKADKVVPLKKGKKSKQAVDLKKSKFLNLEVTKSETKFSGSGIRDFQKKQESHLKDDEVSETEAGICEISVPEILNFVGLKQSTRVATKIEEFESREKVYGREEKEKTEVDDVEILLDPLRNENKLKELQMELSQIKKKCDYQVNSFPESSDESIINKVTPSRKDRKRIRMLDSLKPSKKIKLEDDCREEQFPLEIAEKENLEEKLELILPTNKEKSEIFIPKCDGFPNATNGRISSRALRIIALVPESIKGGQMQWETSPRVEMLKCKKAPNVDKNSRASKMLALLSGNVVELEESDDVRMEEVDSNKRLSTTPNMKTPVSSFKSPKSDKKRKFIRFDDTQNETVLYLTDTPPSQILEEKEKCRKTKISGNFKITELT